MINISFSIWFLGLAIINLVYAYTHWLEENISGFLFQVSVAMFSFVFFNINLMELRRRRRQHENIRLMLNTRLFSLNPTTQKVHNWLREGF